jgi:hypothetical protein
MRPALRQRIIARIYGDGFGAFVAATATDRALTHLRHAVHKPPETLDVSKLIPGETYVVTTRPAPRRKERKLEREALEARARFDQASRPSRSTVRLERRLARVARRVESSAPGSRRQARAAAELMKGERQLEARLRPSSKTVRLGAAAAVAEARLAREQARMAAKARKRARAPRRRVWR